MSETTAQKQEMPDTKVARMILEMFQIQDQLNTNSYAKEWLEKGASEEFDYSLAAGQELGEFFNSLPYSWWSKAEPDRKNCVTEIIDAWHFIMSQLIIDYRGDVAYSAFFANQRYEKFAASMDSKIEQSNNSSRVIAKRLTATLYLRDAAVASSMEHYIYVFWGLCHAYSLPIEHLYARYVGKAVLNRFRVDNGYKRKEYDKIWTLYQGEDKKVEEDNYFLSDYIDAAVANGLQIDQDSVYEWLTKTYAQHKGNLTKSQTA
jgi:dimeric dUTPase (all-alpha-NTP-PPase superfamily)